MAVQPYQNHSNTTRNQYPNHEEKTVNKIVCESEWWLSHSIRVGTRRIIGSRSRPRSYFWLAGYWTWRNDRYEWMAGQWELPPSSSSAWVAPRWEQQGNAYRFYEGYWN